jgi:hypothetical protein
VKVSVNVKVNETVSVIVNVRACVKVSVNVKVNETVSVSVNVIVVVSVSVSVRSTVSVNVNVNVGVAWSSDRMVSSNRLVRLSNGGFVAYQHGSTYISACRSDSREISNAKTLFLRSRL